MTCTTLVKPPRRESRNFSGAVPTGFKVLQPSDPCLVVEVAPMARSFPTSHGEVGNLELYTHKDTLIKPKELKKFPRRSEPKDQHPLLKWGSSYVEK